jgi:hypothetical protein
MSQRAAAVALSALLLIAGCGGDDGAPSGSGSGSPSPTQTATVLTAAQLGEAQLTVADLPAGWKEVPVDEDDEGAAEGECGQKFEALEDLESEVSDDAAFEQGDQGLPSLETSVFSYADPAAFTAEVTAFRDLLAECPEVVLNVDGERITLKLSERPFQGIGEEQFGLAASTTVQGVPFQVLAVAARVGNNGVSAFYTTIGDADATFVGTAAQKLLAKLKTVTG